jgi:hypothetical protein
MREPWVAIMNIFSFDHLVFDYEPFPIGHKSPFVSDRFYNEMLAAWPDAEQFAYLPELGRKYSLSERNNPGQYRRLVRSNPIWNAVWREIKHPHFIDRVVDELKRAHIDLGLSRCNERGRVAGHAARQLLSKCLSAFSATRIRSRFEFSMMPSVGGCIKPHTDSPHKLITLVYSLTTPDRWQPAWGGGTDVLRMRDPHQSFNHINRQAEFEDVEVIRTYPFIPNQLVLFVKTFNSWHSVHPMSGTEPSQMRCTLTINIERT